MNDAKELRLHDLGLAAMNSGGGPVPRAFIACPISDLIDVRTKRLVPEYERFIRKLRQMVTEVFESCFLALDREMWGQNLMEPHSCAPLDFEEMKAADLVVAYPGGSCGVSVELGWASAYGKPIVLLLERDRRYSPLIEGLPSLSGATVSVIYLPPQSDGAEYDLPEVEVRAALAAHMAALHARARPMVHDAGDGRIGSSRAAPGHGRTESAG